jgi:hypothetical protein
VHNLKIGLIASTQNCGFRSRQANEYAFSLTLGHLLSILFWLLALLWGMSKHVVNVSIAAEQKGMLLPLIWPFRLNQGRL